MEKDGSVPMRSDGLGFSLAWHRATESGLAWLGGFFLWYLLSQSPPAREPLTRVRKPNLHSDSGQNSNPCAWRPSDLKARMVPLYHGGHFDGIVLFSYQLISFCSIVHSLRSLYDLLLH
ncbi:hypothetical protein E2C01_008948 [Portunus trituberculatus]|uniref:Uncharacterized protein n=1 Tax=Portunus trituberculatus TaxID=210409 RepID=A0A5B7D3N6_PORTR|nr:hypothetical protein [Portunus trituberculatus]